MQLNETQWHVRWFRWNQRVLDRFADRDEDLSLYLTRRGTNLCTYMRTILLGTVVSVLSIGWWMLLAAFAMMPFWAFGLLGVGIGLSIVAMFIGVIIAVVWLAGQGIPNVVITVRGMFVPGDGQPVGMLACVYQWIRACKQRICPIITFSKDQ